MYCGLLIISTSLVCCSVIVFIVDWSLRNENVEELEDDLPTGEIVVEYVVFDTVISSTVPSTVGNVVLFQVPDFVVLRNVLSSILVFLSVGDVVSMMALDSCVLIKVLSPIRVIRSVSSVCSVGISVITSFVVVVSVVADSVVVKSEDLVVNKTDSSADVCS